MKFHYRNSSNRHNQFADELPRTYDFYAHSDLSYTQRGLLEKFTPLQKLLPNSAVCILEKQTFPKEIEANQNKTFLQTDFCMNQKLPLGFQNIL